MSNRNYQPGTADFYREIDNELDKMKDEVKKDNNCPNCGTEMMLESYGAEKWQQRFRCPNCGNLI